MPMLWPKDASTLIRSPVTGQFISVDGENVPLTFEMQNAITAGDLLEYDPSEGPDALQYVPNLAGTLGLLIDTHLQTMIGLYPDQTVTCVGGETEGDGLEGQFQWRPGSSTTEDGEDVIQVGSRSGRWHRITSAGSGVSTLTGDVIGDASSNAIASIGGTALDDMEEDEILVSDGAGGLTRRPLPGDLPVINLADYLDVNGGNGTVNDTAAVQAWLAAIRDPVTGNARGIGYLPLATNFFRIQSTITIQDLKGMRMFYAATGGAEFRWHGTAGQPMFVLDGVQDCQFGGLIGRNGSANPSYIFHVIERSNEDFFETDRNTFEDIVCSSGGAHCAVPFYFDAGSGEHYVNRCEVSGYTVSGAHIRAGARVNFRSFRANGNLSAGAKGLVCDGGSFTSDGAAGGGGYHTVDFWIKSNDMPCDIYAWNSEGSARWVDIGDPENPDDNPSGPPVSIRGKRFDASSTLALDGRGIRIFSGTPVSISGGMFVVVSPTGQPGRIYLATPNPRSIDIGQNTWTNFQYAGYDSARAASGVGTYYQSVLEWPDTWAAPPTVSGSAYQSCFLHSAGVFNQYAFPQRVALRAFSRATRIRGTNAMVRTSFTSQTGTTLTYNFTVGSPYPTNEPDTNFEPMISIRVTGGSPTGALKAHVTAFTASTISLQFNQDLAGLSFTVSAIIARMS